MRTLEDALETVRTREREDGYILRGAEVTVCGKVSRVRLGDGLNGVIYAYDSESGELVSAMSYADVITDDGCTGSKHWGEPIELECDDGCVVFNDRSEEFLVLNPVCDDDLEVAEPFVQACEARAEAAGAGCAECACTQCYPFVAAASALNLETFPDDYELDCVREDCAEPCAAVLPGR